MVAAGRLRHTVTVQVPNQTGTGSRGQPIFGPPTVLGTVQAEIVPLTGRRLELARQLVDTASHQVTLRYLAGVTPQAQIIFQGRTLRIDHVENVRELGFTLVCTCTEVQG